MKAERDENDFENYKPISRKQQKTGPTVWEIALGVWIGGILTLITWTILGWLMFGGVISAMNRLYLK